MASELKKKLAQCERQQQVTEPTPKAEDFEARLLETITANPGLNTPQLVVRLGRSLRTTQRYLKQLSDAKRIVFKGVAKKGGYHPVDSSSLGCLNCSRFKVVENDHFEI